MNEFCQFLLLPSFISCQSHACTLSEISSVHGLGRVVMTTALNYVVGVYGGKVLRDLDILPLQGFQWVSDQLLDCWATCLERRFTVPSQNSSVSAFPLREFTAITTTDDSQTMLRSRNVSNWRLSSLSSFHHEHLFLFFFSACYSGTVPERRPYII